MFIKDILFKLLFECSFGDGLDYMGKITLYYCFIKRRDCTLGVSRGCSDLYQKYLKWEASMTREEDKSLSCRFFGDPYSGLVVDDIVRMGEDFINSMYLALCNKNLIRKPFDGTIIEYIDSWLDKNECLWLSYVM